MFHPIFVNYMEQQIINNGESGLSVRNKINGMFANLISGSEGINAIWKQIGINLNYTAEIDNVETLNATSKAWGEIYITGKKFVFNFGIPQGYDGGMIIIRKTYSSVAEMNADKNPMGDDDIAIGGGQIVSVFNPSNPDENAFYSRTADGWKLQLGVVKEFRDEMTSQVNSVKQKADESKANIQSLVNALPVTQTTGDSTTSVMSQKAVTDKINDVYKKSNYNDGDNIIDFNTIHIITDNPEYICVAVDADEKILYGIKTDGQPYFGVGCPQQVKDYVNEQINKIHGNLVHDMEQWNDRIAILESAKLQPKTIIEATDVVEWIDNNNTVIPVNISLQDEQGHIDDDSNYTDKQLLYSYQNSKETSTQGEVSFNVSFNNPDKVTIAANGYAKYKGVNVVFPSTTKTVYAVLPSYIGYVDSVDNWNKNGQKLVKHSINGSYNVTNGFKGNAYLVVAIPKNGAVDGIHTIVQHGMLDARQSVSTYEKNGYTLYVCKTAHNPGTYNFIIS